MQNWLIREWPPENHNCTKSYMKDCQDLTVRNLNMIPVCLNVTAIVDDMILNICTSINKLTIHTSIDRKCWEKPPKKPSPLQFPHSISFVPTATQSHWSTKQTTQVEFKFSGENTRKSKQLSLSVNCRL